MQRRRDATQATKDRFQGKPFQFGRNDCWQMVRSHLRAMGRPVKQAARASSYHSLLGAERQLRKFGYRSVIEVMDAHFPRIAPAAATLGDVVSLPSEEGPGGLCIYVGNGRVFGYHQDAVGAEVLQPAVISSAWRVG
jgi:hypothetical protein